MNMRSKISIPSDFYVTNNPLRRLSWVLFASWPFCLMILNIVPAINFGYAKQAEAIHVTYLLGNSLYAIYFLMSFGLNAFIPYVKEPIGLALVTLACLSGFLSLFHPSPIMDYLGSVQMGEGSCLFWALFFQYIQLRRVANLKAYTMVVSFWAIIFIVLMLTGNNEPIGLWNQYLQPLYRAPLHDHAASWAPYWFPDPAAFLILPLVTLFLLNRGRLSIALQVPIVIVLAVMTVFSCNSVFKYGLILAGMAVFLAYQFPQWFTKKHIPFFVLAATVLVAIFGYFADLLDFLPENIVQRALLLKVITAHYAHHFGWQELLELLVGRGWGSFNTFLTENVYLLDVSAYTGTKLQVSWESLIRDQFHSHNVVFEYALSMGLIGLTILGYLCLKIVQHLKDESFYIGLFYITTLILLSSFWFQNTASLPYNLFILVILSKNKPLSNNFVTKLTPLLSKIIPLGLVLTITGSALQGYVSQYILIHHNGKSVKTLLNDLEQFSQSWQARFDKHQDFYRSNNFCLYHMTAIDKILTLKGAKTKKIFAINKIWSKFLLDNVNGHVLGASRITIANLLGLNVLNPRLKRYSSEEDYRLWEKSVSDIIRYMPYRGDMAVPLLSSYLAADKNDKALKLIDEILQKHPENAAALWFRGLILMQDDRTAQEGLANANLALEKGVNRFMPVDEQQAARIKAVYQSLRP